MEHYQSELYKIGKIIIWRINLKNQFANNYFAILKFRKKLRNFMAKRKSYRRKPAKPTQRRRTTRSTVKSRRKQKENKLLDVIAKIIRLIVLIGICGFIIYRLFLHDKKAGPPMPQKEQQPAKAEDSVIVEPIEQKVDLDALPKDQALDYLLGDLFDSFNLEDSWIKRKQNTLIVQLPEEVPAVTIIYEIIQEIKQLDLKVLQSEEDLRAEKSTITIGSEKLTLLTIIFSKNINLERKAGKIAIIIDDFGYYDNETTEKFLNFNYPITLAIIPGQRHSTRMAELSKKSNKPIMIHLPMEAIEEKVENSEFTVMTNLPDSVIAERVRKAIAALPGAVGINNHMGSKATTDTRVMETVMGQLKSNKKIFVDSKTTNKSVVSESAAKYGVKFAVNDGFLERNKNEDEIYIQRKLAAIAKIAKSRGKAIVIGHPYSETIKVLSKEIPKLEKMGFRIVPVTDLVR